MELDWEARQQQRWAQWQERSGGQLPQPDAEQMRQLGLVWEASDYVYQCCLREPDLLPRLLQQTPTEAPGQESIEQQLAQQLLPVVDEAGLQRQLRLFRREWMCRIIWRDLAGLATLDETLEALSSLADACIRQALAKLYGWAMAKQGVPRDCEGNPQHLLVLGMGKLGARELNLSSDIDLIFCYPEQGEVEGGRGLSNEQFFTRLCQQLVRALNTQTADGFVFRVDTRLRPFGDSGPLALCFDALETYYQANAREWERYAMIKARVVAGPEEDAAQLMALLRPFVYRRYLDYGAFESLREMKSLISREVKRKGMEHNVKLGPGGIREIEFIGQAFQLIRGGRDTELQVRPILRVLELLGSKDLMPEYAISELSRAYRYLRLVENRIQAWQDRQTHLLPDDDAGRLRLARSMGYSDWAGFSADLEQHRSCVQGHFDKVFSAPQAEQNEDQSGLAALWQGGMEESQAISLLEWNGFSDAVECLRRIESFRSSSACRGLGSKGRQRLGQLMPMLLEAIGGSGQSLQLLERLLSLLEAIAKRTAYLAMLVENPMALSQVVRLVGASPWIGQQLERHPLLLDEMIDPRRLYSPLNRAELEAELADQLAQLEPDDLEQQMERLRQFAQSNMLRVAAADLTEVIPLMVVSDYLTDIAEVVTDQVRKIAWSNMVSRHGRPVGTTDDAQGFVVVGYGKMGGIELGYGSDLDMVFLHDDVDFNAMTDGERPLAENVFYVRLGQRMIHIFTTRTPSGRLYEVDMRLRPNGNSGLLVSSMGAFEQYQLEQAWTWEHQALLRARVVSGDAALAARFAEIRKRVLSQQRDPEKLRLEVVGMREKMRASLDKSGQGLFDLKQGAGGIADIEFMVQYAVIRWASQYPELLDWTDNIRLLEGLGRCRLLDGALVDDLADAYRELRAVYHRKTLGEQPGLIGDSELCEPRSRVREAWRVMMTLDAGADG